MQPSFPPAAVDILESRRLLTQFVVDTTADTDSAGTTTLRDAINQANHDSGDTITFASTLAGKTITLTQGVLDVTSSMTITGLGASQLTIDGNNHSGIFHIENQSESLSQQVTITGLTLQHAYEDASLVHSGAIFNAATLTLSDDTITNNSTDGGPEAESGGLGAGVDNDGTLTSTNDTITHNSVFGTSSGFSGEGGGICNEGALTSTDDTISDNSASVNGLGGGVYNLETMTLTGDMITNNSATDGGGVFNSGFFSTDQAVLIKNTIAGNTAADGGGIANFGGTLTSNQNTITGNTAGTDGGGGIWNTVGNDLTGTGLFTSTGDTISDNSTTGAGGGILNITAVWTGTNDTIAGNSAATNGGGIDSYAESYGTVLTTVNTTIANNSAQAGGGGGVFASSYGIWNSWNTLVAANPSGEDVAVGTTNVTINANTTLVGDSSLTTAEITSGSGNILDPANQTIFVTDSSGHPLLTNNGGPTQTIALASNSPAIGVGGALATLTVAVTDPTATSFTVNDVTALVVGDELKIDNEIVTVLAVNVNTKQLSVERGQMGTTATTHSSDAAISLAYDERGALRTSADVGAYTVAVVMPTTCTLSSTVTPSVFDQWVTFTATVGVVNPGVGTPTGTVIFEDGTTKIGYGTLSVKNGHVVATFNTSSLAVGSHSITAIYAGDVNFSTITSAPFKQTVGKASTTSTVSSSAASSALGQWVTFTATVGVVSPAAGTPTGTVIFEDGGTKIGNGTLSVKNGHVVATFNTSSLALGTHSMTAIYSGDSNFSTSTSAAFKQIVGKATTSTVSSSANPSVFGQWVTFTATVGVVSPGTGTPTGTVTFEDGGTKIGEGTLSVKNGHVVATFNISSLAVGTHSITAIYAGDGNFMSSTSAPFTQTIVKASTASTVSSSVNPSVLGQWVTFTATVGVISPGAGTPTGTVTFEDGGTKIGNGTLSVKNGLVVATFNISSLAVGTHSITAVYAGNSNFITSTSATFTQTIVKASTTSTVSSSVNPSVLGQWVTFTATVGVISPGAGTPTGTVTFEDGGTKIGNGTLSVKNGLVVATFNISSLAVGTHSITAIYAGDGNFITSTSAAFNQTVLE